ncbi:MAG TPA: phosphopantetheine-binding protein [Bryobacteraceae bacterium]
MTDAGNENFDRRFNDVLLQYLRSLSNLEEVPAGTDLMKLGLDSMAAVSLLLDLEEKFGVVFPADTINVQLYSSAEVLRSALLALMKSPV